ncbi:DUF5916 domain-containing protein [Cognatilysobacter terrigena]|uniref:DUF5916 domain-containing protein n=1 Tax=Cognatilysobacter terrigena TaxID=2488749 RepID=UPI00105DD737|nr:DUF5916 domain-containing protein [Lysobacter terrigena]
MSAVFRAALALVVFCTLPSLALAATEVKVDGHIDPTEWADAQHVTDFRLTQPLSRAPAPLPTEAWFKATPDGLAIAFHNSQPAGVPRRRDRAQRDQGGPFDRVNLYVDFDGDGRTGYNFTILLSDSIIDAVITNENQFSTDWDGNWRHAVSEDAEGWSAEMLIPWYTATMRDAPGTTRRIGIVLDRVIGSTGERATWPAVSFSEPRFLSVFEKVDVPKYSQSLLAITPYVVGVYDNVAHKANFDTGADIFWKPSGKFQLSATLNPDFGQVESDQLVVNFSAIETFFSDKRPFFTENQSFFDVAFGSLNNANRLLYTRRVGGTRDDGLGAGDVTAAVKLNGSAAGINYGVFAATEADDVGRDFYAVRATKDLQTQGFGAMVTRVDRPFLDRVANVAEFDHRWTPTGALSVRTTVVGSDVDQAGRSIRDSGAQIKFDQDLGKGWRQQLYLLHLGDHLQLNDFGYLERNNFNYGRYEISRRFTDLPKESSYASHQWRAAVSHRANDDGVKIADAWSVNRTSDMRDGGNEFFEVASFTPGHDDLVTRGHGIVRMPSKLYLFYERGIPRRGPWGFYWNSRYAAESLGGWNHGSISLDVEPTYYISDNANVGLAVEVKHDPGLLLWHPGVDGVSSLATYRVNQVFLAAGVTWLIDNKQELRVRLEAIGLDARAPQSYDLAADGTPIPVASRHQPFGLSNMGFQVRYRYELAPLSNLYIAYVRGGGLFEEPALGDVDAAGRLRDAFDLRDSEQLLVKLAYRFDI